MERINKLLAHAGVGSRRQCDAMIRAGRVAIDGSPIRDLGTKTDPELHRLTVDGHPVDLEPTFIGSSTSPAVSSAPTMTRPAEPERLTWSRTSSNAYIPLAGWTK